jgi:hypothetical protein
MNSLNLTTAFSAGQPLTDVFDAINNVCGWCRHDEYARR